ncbi:MAG: hypothetical protein ACYCWW_07340 [Deltaproteobacteria bacterium]
MRAETHGRRWRGSPIGGLVVLLLLLLLVAVEALPAAGMSPEGFVGFSSDSSLFAYAGFSQGAGVTILTVIRCADGTIEREIAMHDAQSESDARRVLEEHRFAPRPNREPPAIAKLFDLEARIDDQGALSFVLRRRSDGRAEPLPGRARAQVTVSGAALWGFSPNGRYAAFRETLRSGTEFGRRATYEVVDVARAVQAFEPEPGSARLGDPAAHPDGK